MDESSARRRLKGFASAADHKLLVGFGLLLSIYAFVTFAALNVLPSLHNLDKDVPFFEQKGRLRSKDESSTGISQQEQFQLRTPPKEYYKLSDIKTVEELQLTFPVHVGDDMEDINHPGIQFADAEKMRIIAKVHNLPTRIAVPRFWRPTQYGPGGVREFLGNHGERLITPEEASKIGSFVDAGDGQFLETIYVSVASYRDPECTPTVEDLYERAKYPERIRVAIIDQRADGDPYCTRPEVPCEQNPNQTLCRFRHLIDVFEISAPLSIGPVFARHLAHRMYRGEYFAMQVDSHIRSIEGWDSSLIAQWKSATNEMAVITTYLSDIIGSIDPVTHENRHPARPIMCQTGYESAGKMKHLRHGQQPEGIPGIHGEPTLHPFWAAGFSFARGHFVVQVPYDQYQPMVFQGEEIFVGLRGWTYGYDYYTLEISVAFHM
jgi:[Skp1-protein]-hydroxyproline N-acetylglucosaminyltransferase